MDRRDLLATIGTLSIGLMTRSYSNASTPSQENEKEVSAVEDLMREHGVLRRALFIYSESAAKLRSTSSVIPLDALYKTAALFRSFGEDYHEKKLEEAHIFPAVKAAGGPAAAYSDILIVQHSRGREITDYILSATKGKNMLEDRPQMIMALESFVRMYRPHAAREDTVVFPAWKIILTDEQLKEMSELFEEIETQQFGHDGFENAVQQIVDIEATLGMTNLAQYTAPPVTS